ncbi:unnamed protein product [Lepeophtheirus salmonis]|uniref:(salmon louse) hypothetical protein n=1 Tax=Lepeophtheirus salmonis TaxID=72036 RepID=A0A7R8CNJ7_LEPSM|nr:unnamed protein product [Lepeophtheirus salmonis]CAF2842472.1 unnamed protein product [Lepeophtheirus salmonis]
MMYIFMVFSLFALRNSLAQTSSSHQIDEFIHSLENEWNLLNILLNREHEEWKNQNSRILKDSVNQQNQITEEDMKRINLWNLLANTRSNGDVSSESIENNWV